MVQRTKYNKKALIHLPRYISISSIGFFLPPLFQINLNCLHSKFAGQYTLCADLLRSKILSMPQSCDSASAIPRYLVTNSTPSNLEDFSWFKNGPSIRRCNRHWTPSNVIPTSHIGRWNVQVFECHLSANSVTMH
jgi:hypothetical protein